MPQLLVVDDNEIDRAFVASLTQGCIGYDCIHAASGLEALELLKKDKGNNIAAVLLDLSMPDMDGKTTLIHLRKLREHLQVIAVTASNDVADIVDIIKLGAVDYLTKPVDSVLFGSALNKALQIYEMRKELERLRDKGDSVTAFADLVGTSDAMQTCAKLGQRAATSDITVLITGESGTGKEMMARAIHYQSNRAGKPFVAVNCGALPKDLVESTLFGHKKGSFTGAFADAPGKFLEANGGTLFLDEVGELPLEAQVKLLRALQEREIEPVGGSKTIPVNIRIIAATNRNPLQAMRQGYLREDLYYRLNVFPIVMPPLRERADDILVLADYFLRRYAAAEHKVVTGFETTCSNWMLQHNWPGNIRELENAIFRSVLLCDRDTIGLEHLLHEGTTSIDSIVELAELTNNSTPYKINLLDSNGNFKNMDSIKREVEKAALAFNNNNVVLAARQLGIGMSTLYRHRQS